MCGTSVPVIKPLGPTRDGWTWWGSWLSRVHSMRGRSRVVVLKAHEWCTSIHQLLIIAHKMYAVLRTIYVYYRTNSAVHQLVNVQNVGRTFDVCIILTSKLWTAFRDASKADSMSFLSSLKDWKIPCNFVTTQHIIKALLSNACNLKYITSNYIAWIYYIVSYS